MRILNRNFSPSSWPTDYQHWLEQGRYNREFEQYDKYLSADHTFVDVGAWVGAHSLYAAQICKKVVAVEPDPVAFDILKQNVSDCLQFAISDKPGVATLGSGFLGASTTRFNPNAGSGIGPWVEGQTFEVECITLRELVKDLPDNLFFKIDVEGAEERIFRDVALFAERKTGVLVELHPWWWEDPIRAAKDFEFIKTLYREAIEVFHNTWVLHD